HRHNQIVPVRLHRAQNDEHFATATIRYMKDFASFFGNGCDEVFLDDIIK
ncbi:unnamed protein product, partial [Rotaria sordida]